MVGSTSVGERGPEKTPPPTARPSGKGIVNEALGSEERKFEGRPTSSDPVGEGQEIESKYVEDSPGEKTLREELSDLLSLV